MKHTNIGKSISAFKPLIRSKKVQAAMMALSPGDSSSDNLENEHPAAEQWLFVISGTGLARVGKRRQQLSGGSLLYIPKRARHQITNTGRRKLVTINFYSPPAYTSAGDVRPTVAK